MFRNKLATFCHAMLLMLLWCAVPAAAQAENTLNMQQFGKQTVTVSDELTFYDMKGTGKINSSSSNNSMATVVFKPADAGKAIQIVFESIDVRNDGASWPAYVNVYAGEFDADNTFTYPTTTGGVSGSKDFPTNENLLASLDGKYSNLEYTSTDASGALSVCFQYKYAKSCEGWVAKVRQVTVSDMKLTSAATTYAGVPASVYAGKTGVALGSLQIVTDGIMHPDTLTSVSYSLTKNGGVVDATKLRLMRGDNAVDATVTDAGNGIYTMALSSKLGVGESTYTIVGDVLESAPFGGEVALDITGFATKAYPAGYTGLVKGESAVSKVAPMVLIGTTPATHTVGDEPFSFYDDGGPEGNISQNFAGQVTFKPATAGKKVMIDFSMIDLFNTSTIGKNDILNVYYGSTANPDSLAVTYLKEKSGVIRSIAADGALTVTLTSTTGTGFKKGFEATVSQFTPQAMTLSGVTADQPTTTTVAAGDTSQPIMRLKLVAANTEPALRAQKMAFTTAGTNANIAGASVYFTGKSADFSTAKKAGEAAVNADDFEVPFTTDVALTEGDNYFWLAYDVNGNALSGGAIDATVKSVTLSGNAQAVAEGNPAGERKIDNVVMSAIGTTHKTIYGEWTYKSTPNSSYSETGYASTAGDQTVVFTPGTEGHKIEIEFSKFSISYPYYSSSTAPYFRIYSGSEANAANLLWECTKDTKDVGPEAKLRSTDPNGVMTVVFNANGVSSNSGGWKAAVREYMSQPMTVDSVIVTQASTSVIPTSPAGHNLAIIGFNIATKGDINAKELSKITLNLKGCQDKVAKVMLYNPESADTLGVAVPDASKQSLDVALKTPATLVEGSNNFIVAFDMLDGVSAGQSIDAALTSITVSGSDVAVTNGDPAGERVTKNIYLMEPGTGHVVTVGPEGLMFYDDGGATDKTSKGLKGTVTFVPRDPGKVVRMVIKEWGVGANDNFNLSFGGEAKATPDVKWSNTKAGVGTDLRSLSDDGKLTFNVSAGSYYQGDGWAIEVSEYELQSLSIDSVNVTPVCAARTMAGATEVMQRIDVNVGGDKGNLNVSSLNLKVDAMQLTDVAAVRVVATDTTSVYNDSKVLAELKPVTSADNEIALDYNVTLPGTYKLWVVYDIASSATQQNTIKAAVQGLTISGNTTDLSATPVAKTTVGRGMHGTFTVGASSKADFPTIKAAVTAMANGIDGPVVLNLESGSYNEVVTIKDIKGASATNTITLRSQSGKYQEVVIYDNKYNEPTYSDDKLAKEFGVLTVYGTPYVTVEGVTVSTTDTSYPSVVRLQNGSTHFTLRNSKLLAPETESYSANVDLFEVYSASHQPQQVNHYITIDNNVLDGAYNALSMGAQWITNPYETGDVITNNVFRNQGAKGIYLMDADNVTIKGNVFENNVTAKSDYNAIDITSTGRNLIEGNTFNLATKNYCTAIYVRSLLSDEAQPSVIANNAISMAPESTSASYAIRFSSASSNVNVAYNTVRIVGGGSSTAAVMLGDVVKGTFVNNLLQNEGAGYVWRANKAAYIADAEFKHNVMHTAGTSIAYVAEAISGREDWAEVSGDTTSIDASKTFVSDIELMPESADNLNIAEPLSYVTTDITGATRAAAPTVGAYEFSDQFPIPAYAEGYPQFVGIANTSATMVVKTTASGMAAVLVKKAGEAAPTSDEVEGSDNIVEVRRGVEAEIALSGLEKSTDYKAYTVLYNVKGEKSGVLVSDVFTTTTDPTQVSTFENVTTTDTGFTDGTAAFKGFEVVTVTDAVVDGSKAAQVAAGATGEITITNSEKGLVLNGFFLKSTSTVAAATADTAFTLPSTGGKWMFINLRDKGLIATLKLTASDSLFQIDNFSGEPLDLIAMLSDVTVNQGEQFTLAPSISASRGVAPYTYKWTNLYGADLGTAGSLSMTASSLGIYKLTVTDAWGNTSSTSAQVNVIGKAVPGTFEEKTLESETYWNGENAGNSVSGTLSYWYTGSYLLAVQNHTATWWGGFGLSNETSTEFSSLSHQFRSSTGGGHNSSNYGVYYPLSSSDLRVTNSADGDSINGFYITNNAYALTSMLNGDGMAKPFKKGDYFKVTIKGYNGTSQATGSVDFYLGDYRADNSADRYLLDTWQWVDLRPLGKVKTLTFSFDGTKENDMGLTTPTYFCLDDLNGERDITVANQVIVPVGSKNVQLAGLFTLEGNGATVTYAFPDGIDSTDIEAAIDDNGMLTLTGKTEGAETSVLLSATEAGKTQFVRLPIRVGRGTGVDQVGVTTDVAIYPVPVTSVLNIATSLADYSVSVFNTAGAAVYSKAGLNGNVTIECGNWAAGVYVVKIAAADGTNVVRRITVK